MNEQLENQEISSLIRLLDDGDEFVWTRVQKRLIELGEDALPFLEMAVRDENLARSRRALGAIQAIRPIQIREKFRALALTHRDRDIDLESGMLILSEYGHPETDSEMCRKILDELATGLAKRLPKDPTPERIVRELGHYLFFEQGFKGNKADYSHPDNSFFHPFLIRKLGLPISLAALCILISHRLNLNIAGVGLPCHFIAMYNTPEETIYFDPFNKGKKLSPDDCRDLVRGFGFKFYDHHLAPVSNRDILVRMINNLAVSFNRMDLKEKAKQLLEYSNILMTPHKEASRNQWRK